MPVPNPDPTTTTTTVNVIHDGEIIGSGDLVVEAWELVIEAFLESITITLPPGTWRAIATLGYSSDDNKILPKVVSSDQTGADDLVVPELSRDGYRSIDGEDVKVVAHISVYEDVAGDWVNYASGIANVVVPPQTDMIDNFQVIAQVQALDGEKNLLGFERPIYEAKLDVAEDLGLDWIRFSLPWFFMQELNGVGFHALRQPRIVEIVDAIKDRGLKVMMILGGFGVPCWASSAVGKNCSTYEGRYAAASVEPSDYNYYRDYVTAAVDLFAPDAIEVQNEPNHSDSPMVDHPEWCVRFTKACWDGVKASTHPNTPVVAGVLAYADTAYLELLYTTEGGIKNYCDAISVHPYNLDHDSPEGTTLMPFNTFPSWQPAEPEDVDADLILGTHAIHKVMRAHGDGTKPIWISEWGYTSKSTFIEPIDEVAKGKWLAYGLRQQAYLPYVEVAGFFTLVDARTGTSGEGFGLVDNQLREKASYDAVKTAIAALHV